MIRPERFLVGAEAACADNQFMGEVRSVTFTGDRIKYEIALSETDIVRAVVPNRGDRTTALGQSALIGWRTQDAILFESE
jgi:hypothetical protein